MTEPMTPERVEELYRQSHGGGLVKDPSKIAQIIHANPEDPTVRIRLGMSGPLNRVTGYGNHFTELVRSLLHLGCDIRMYPKSVEPPLPAEILATLMEPWDMSAPVGICMANPTSLERISSHTIGITTWETTDFPPDHRRQLSAIDEFIVPCKDNIALIEKYAPGKPVHFVPEGIDTEFWTPPHPSDEASRVWSGSPLKIAMFGDLSPRKGIELGVEAFTRSFENDPSVELHIAITNPYIPIDHLQENFSNIFIHRFGAKPREEVRAFFHQMHALLAPYRGEGFYLPGAEFMATGGCLIAPSLMGASYYCHPDKAFVIPSKLGRVKWWGAYVGYEAWSRFGTWVTYGDSVTEEIQTVQSSLEAFVNTSPQQRKRIGDAAAGQIPFLCDPLMCAQKTLDIVKAAL